ncbi:MAG: glutaminyl-peptide cyclotransferase [Anaerolineae bacterium]|nr:glutaminyl-peptide cyclotransferase [Anaerolineae bacterium]
MVSATPTTLVTPLSPSATPDPVVTPPTPSLIIKSPVSTPTLLPIPAPGKPVDYTYKIINTYPHDRNAFTQGLIFMDGVLYEGTGLYGRSSLRRVDLETGQVLQSLSLPPQFFGEGITLFGNQIIQLTWKANTGFVYDKDSFALKKSFGYPTQGWGITHDGARLIMSDGTANLYFWDPETLAEIGRVAVYDNNGPVVRLNELEYINGEVYANVWQTNLIARIDPTTGRVLGWIRLDGLLTTEDLSEPVDVLNGIAYDAENKRLFVTGKLWPKLFEIELVPVE